jgi:hypothetical protein
VRRLLRAHRKQLTPFIALELTVEAERNVRRERETRPGVRQSALNYPLVKHAKRSVRSEREHDDVGLHEPNGSAELEGEGRRRACYWLERGAELIDRGRRRDRPRTG